MHMSSPPQTAVIFCAGEGTRLRPLTNTVPKCLVEIDGEPLLFRWLRALATAGVRQFCINTHHLAEAVQYAVEESEWRVAACLSYEPILLGSAGALLAFSELLDRPFYAVYGDVSTDTDVARLWTAHRQHAAFTTMLVHDRVDPTSGGMVVFNKETGRVRRFCEKPSRSAVVSPWVNAGVFVMDPQVLRYVPVETSFDIGHDLIPALLSAGEHVQAVRLEDSSYLVDIGTHEALELARTIVKARR